MASIEEKVGEHYKKTLCELGIRHYGKTESINRTITDALRSADSKSGGSGNNYPDIQLLLDNKTARRIPVMIEAKGLKKRLEKISKSGQIELITYYEKDSKRKDGTIQHHAGDANYSSIMNYAVNGAVHYANAILDSRGYTEVIAIGINGTQMNADGSVQDAECRAYYISEKNNRVPKYIPELDKEWSLLKADNLDRFFAMLDKMTLTEKELEDLRQLYATAFDYDKDSKTTRLFFQTVQNKLHYAVHRHTAAELIVERADAAKEHMGLTTWENAPEGKIVRADVTVAKNYLSEKEMSYLERIVSLYLDYAELQAERRIPMSMEDWAKRLDGFLEFNGKELLTGPGKISAEQAKLHAETEFEKYRIIQDRLYESDFDRFLMLEQFAEDTVTES